MSDMSINSPPASGPGVKRSRESRQRSGNKSKYKAPFAASLRRETSEDSTWSAGSRQVAASGSADGTMAGEVELRPLLLPNACNVVREDFDARAVEEFWEDPRPPSLHGRSLHDLVRKTAFLNENVGEGKNKWTVDDESDPVSECLPGKAERCEIEAPDPAKGGERKGELRPLVKEMEFSFCSHVILQCRAAVTRDPFLASIEFSDSTLDLIVESISEDSHIWLTRPQQRREKLE